MRLYTEKEVRDAIDMAREGVRSKDGIIDTLNFIKPPIELPSDEDIEDEALISFTPSGLVYTLAVNKGFICGAKWMRDKIEGGNK